LALVPLIALGNLRGAALRGLNRIVAGQLPEFVIRPALFALLLAGTGLLMGRQFTAPVAMALHVAAGLIAFMAGAWLLWRSTPLSVRQAQPHSQGKVWLASSSLFALIAGFQMINSQTSTLILGLMETPDQVGVFRVAVQVAPLASFGLHALTMVVTPRFADLYAQGKMASLERLVIDGSRIVLGVNLIITTVFVLLGKWFFGLVFGPDFTASYPLLLILLVGEVVSSATGSPGHLLLMTGNERETVNGIGAAAAVNLALNLLLVPLWGIRGAAIATATSVIVSNVLLWRAARKRLGINSLAFNWNSN
jgi:O-antigen/teichoic acid export membrane protein